MGVHERTLRRYIALGLLGYRRLPGGHYRIPEEAIVALWGESDDAGRRARRRVPTAQHAGTVKGRRLAPAKYAVKLAAEPAELFNHAATPRALREAMRREGVGQSARAHAWRVLSAVLLWAAHSDLVPEIQTNGCLLANEKVGNRRKSVGRQIGTQNDQAPRGGNPQLGALPDGRRADPRGHARARRGGPQTAHRLPRRDAGLDPVRAWAAKPGGLRHPLVRAGARAGPHRRCL